MSTELTPSADVCYVWLGQKLNNKQVSRPLIEIVLRTTVSKAKDESE